MTKWLNISATIPSGKTAVISESCLAVEIVFLTVVPCFAALHQSTERSLAHVGAQCS
ncbi:MAG: hypothetical protein GZ090_02715 [Oxalobacteraceae bacterium]|nr:hypothetical protein [Oxalobacteraceae bacterium]